MDKREVEEAISSYKKEPFYKKAIHNLIKTKNFLNLNLQLAYEEISEKEYDAEIEKNENEYVLTQMENPNKSDILAIMSSADSINMKLDSSDVSEIFGVAHKSIIDHLKKFDTKACTE